MDSKKPFHESVAEQLIEQLRAGTAPWQRPWKPGESHSLLPMNPITGKRYQGINAIHLMGQGRADPRWMTYKQAAAHEAQVRKGEKGTPIQYWKFSEDQVRRDEQGRPLLDPEGQPIKESVRLERPRVFMATVFNAEQIEGLPALQPQTMPLWEGIDRAERILQASGARITHVPGNRAFYRPATDSITLPERGQFETADRYYATALHELGHWTGHEQRLHRDLAHPYGSEGYAREELRAEIASMILGAELGLGHDPGQHAAYVGSWIKVLQQDPLEIFRAAAEAEKIHHYVLAFEQQQTQLQSQEAQPALPTRPEEPAAALAMSQSEELDMPPMSEDQDRVEAWTLKHVARGSLESRLETARLEPIERVMAVLEAMQPLERHNDFWTRHELPPDTAELSSRIQQAGAALERLRPDARVAQARLADELEAMDEAAIQALGFTLPHDWNGLVRVQARGGSGSDDSPPGVAPADSTGQSPVWAVYALDNKGERHHLLDVPGQLAAERLADRLVLIDANSTADSLQRGAKLARWHEERVWRDPASTETSRAAAKAARQSADAKALLNASDPVFGQGQQTAPLSAARDLPVQRRRDYLSVPYGERGAAKAAGALWDPAAKCWYAGPQADQERLERWRPDRLSGQQAPALSSREEFAQALRSLGALVSGEHPIMDGQTHRIRVEGDRQGEQAGFYVAHLDGHPAAYLKNNRTGVEMKWKAKGYALDPVEKARLQAEAADKLAERALEHERTQQATAQRLSQQLDQLLPLERPTPYLQAKGIRPQAGAYTDREGLSTCLPAYDSQGQLWSMQYIQPDGTKRFAKDSRKEGCFHPVGGMQALEAAPVLLIAEGYATAASLSEATGQAAVAAFDSGNLLAVARVLHERFPHKPVLIAGDDDRHLELTQGINPGRFKAEQAARAVGGSAIFPVFASAEHSYPAGLEPVTPAMYRAHEQALARLEADKLGPGAGQLKPQERTELQRDLLGQTQLDALARMKRHTDFNDLASHGEFGREGVQRQLRAAFDQLQELGQQQGRERKPPSLGRARKQGLHSAG